MSTAINMFLKRAIYERGIPFEIKEPVPSNEFQNAWLYEKASRRISSFQNVKELMWRLNTILKGVKECRKCHIEPDWLLIYKILNNELVVFSFWFWKMYNKISENCIMK